MLPLGRDRTWVFAGDSITHAGRTNGRERLGNGYVRILHDYLLAKAPSDMPCICNRGVAGDRIIDLVERWRKDVLSKDPAVVSIMIGVNDVWRQIDSGTDGVELAEFVNCYEKIICDTIKSRADVRLVLCEPTVICPPTNGHGNEMLLPYVMAVRELAASFGEHVACVVGMHHVCLAAERARPDVEWWPDGVHPSPLGHMLLARTWLQATHLL